MKPLERLEPLFADETEEDIDHRAAYWFSRRRSGHFSAACRAELEDWLRADPRHREALEGMERLWREFDGLPRPALDDIPEPVPAWRLASSARWSWRTDRSCSSTSIPRCRCVTPSAPATCC
ncbi:TPA: FecR/PupR family sigma factor regulator [Pseudomonas aeruginosa]